MKNSYILALVIVLSFFSCKKEIQKIEELSVSVSKSKILDDNEDTFLVSVKDQDNNHVTEDVVIVFNDVIQSSNIIRSDTEGVFDLYAEFEDIKSNIVQIEVVEDSGLEYEKIVLIEQYTATWCPWCPRAISQIEDVGTIDNNIAHIAYHLNDEFSYSLNSILAEEFGVAGIPDVIVDRDFSWDGNGSAITSRHNPVRVGIGLEVSDISDNEFTIDVSVRFGKIFADDIKLCIYLIEDGLVADQKSNYNSDSNSPWYQMGTTIPDLDHRNVMLATITNLLGDQVPSTSIDIGSLYEKTYMVSAPGNAGSGTPWITDPAQARIVAFLTYGSGLMMDEVINSVTCSIGATADNELTN